jgi:hypothetical protein
MVGDDHDYERFARLDREGYPDSTSGLREFVVGTGGGYPRGFNKILPTSEFHANGIFGILELKLFSTRYEWRFITTDGGKLLDSGSSQCG